MANQNKFWLGQQQAIIPDLSWVAADWGRGDASANRLRMLNGAFELHFILRKSIENCPDATMRDLMTKELDDAGEAGWGIGVRDLDDAFEHWYGPGKWTDNNLKTYMKANGIFGAATPSVIGAQNCWGLATNAMPGPEAATNYFNSLDSKMDELASVINSHNTEAVNLSNAINAKSGDRTEQALHAVAKHAKRAKKLMFLAPKPNDTFWVDVFTGSAKSAVGGVSGPGSFSGFSDTKPNPTTKVIGAVGAVTFMQAINDVDTFLSVHKSAMSTGIFDNQTSTAFAALAVACSRVPILGSFYAEVVKKLPSFFGAMNDMFKEHNRKIIRDTFVNN